MSIQHHQRSESTRNFNRTRPGVVGLLAALGLLTGCGERSYSDLEEPASPGGGEPEESRQGLVVHEWGTFTSVQSSLGETLEGLHHEEETLPAFVYGRDIRSPIAKAMESLPEGVTQKMETPVIYFHTDKEIDVQVEVGFPQGVISEWYPQAATFRPEVGGLTRVGEGHMRWDAHLTPTSVSMPEVPEEDVWAPSRRVDAASVVVGQEGERFIFYRGLGRFEMPLRVTSDDLQVRVENLSDERVPAVFLLHVHEGGGAVVALGALEPRRDIVMSPSPKEIDLDAYVADASDQIAAALIESGLFEDEAIAMVDTWSRSYFRTPGLRLLYVVPRSWTDALLPLSISPAPDAVVRTLVGRVEILTPDRERAVVDQVRLAVEGGNFDMEALGRFAEPKLRRAAQLAQSDAERALIETLIQQAEGMP